MSEPRIDRRRLFALRIDRRLARRELAERAGLTYRTVLDLERGRRRAVENQTLLRLADALGCSPADLQEDSEAGSTPRRPWRRPRRRTLVLGGAPLVAVLLAAALLLPRWLERRPAIEHGRLTVREGLLGRVVWRLATDAEVLFWAPSPWRDGRILVGLNDSMIDGGRLLLLEGRDGKLVWEFAPDRDQAYRAFGPEIFETDSRLHGTAAWPVDLDGDGVDEVAALFGHALYYPNWLACLDRQGRNLGTYLNRGCLYVHLALDLDGDGRQELLVGGTNNSKALQGATVLLLDRECHTGVSLDTVSGDTACLPDSARIRLVLPSFGPPWMELLKIIRLEASRLTLQRGPDGEPRIEVEVGAGEPACLVTLDAQLRPVAAEPTPWIRQAAAGWPAPWTGGGPADPRWLRQWLERAPRWEAGHYPPDPCPAVTPEG